METKSTAEKGNIVSAIKLIGLVILTLAMNGCSYHDRQFSYFDMLDDKKNTMSNRQAAEKFWSSVRPVSTLSDSFYRLGLHYQQKGEYDKAIKEFTKALRNDATFCKAYNGIAMSYDALGRCEPAHASYDQALKCAPDRAYVFNNYACSSLLCGDYKKGVALLLKAEQLAGDNTRIKNNLRIAQAIAAHERIAESIPTGQQPDTTAESAPTPFFEKNEGIMLPSPPLPSPNPAPVAIEVSNGNGATGMAGRSAGYLRWHGFTVRSITNAQHFRFEESIIYYKEGYLEAAMALAAIIPGAQNLEKVDTLARASIGVRVLLGRDLVNMRFPEGFAGIAGYPQRPTEQLLTSTASFTNNMVH